MNEDRLSPKEGEDMCLGCWTHGLGDVGHTYMNEPLTDCLTESPSENSPRSLVQRVKNYSKMIVAHLKMK